MWSSYLQVVREGVKSGLPRCHLERFPEQLLAPYRRTIADNSLVNTPQFAKASNLRFESVTTHADVVDGLLES